MITITRAHGSQVDILTLEPDAMVRPDNLVAVAQARKFYVNGEVRRAGDYPYERELTLHKAITMAGGFTDKASTSRAKVIRKIEGKEQEISLGLEGIILQEDIIVVPRSFFYQAAEPNIVLPLKFCRAERCLRGSSLPYNAAVTFRLIPLVILLSQPASVSPVCFNYFPETHNGYVQFLALQGLRLVPDQCDR